MWQKIKCFLGFHPSNKREFWGTGVVLLNKGLRLMRTYKCSECGAMWEET